MKPKPKPKPPTAAQYKRLQREASDWRECAWMLLGQLMGTGADTRKSGACRGDGSGEMIHAPDVGLLGGAIVPLNGHAKPESVWSLQQRIEAAQKEVDRIQSNPANKEAVPDSFDRRLRAEPMAKVKALKASISEMRQRMAGVEVAA
jgi:hypothetical protein